MFNCVCTFFCFQGGDKSRSVVSKQYSSILVWSPAFNTMSGTTPVESISCITRFVLTLKTENTTQLRYRWTKSSYFKVILSTNRGASAECNIQSIVVWQNVVPQDGARVQRCTLQLVSVETVRELQGKLFEHVNVCLALQKRRRWNVLYTLHVPHVAVVEEHSHSRLGFVCFRSHSHLSHDPLCTVYNALFHAYVSRQNDARPDAKVEFFRYVCHLSNVRVLSRYFLDLLGNKSFFVRVGIEKPVAKVRRLCS